MMYWDTGKNQGCRPRKKGTSPKWEGVGLSPAEQNRSQDNCAAWDLGWFQRHRCLQLSQVLSPSFLRVSYFWTFQHDTWCFSTLLCPQAAGWAFSSFYCQGAADLSCICFLPATLPTPVLLPGESHGWRSLVGYSPWGREESDTTERLHFHFSLSCTGEGNGNPLQCSCLENPRDGGAWWAAVYGITQSWTQMKQLSSSGSCHSLPTLDVKFSPKFIYSNPLLEKNHS